MFLPFLIQAPLLALVPAAIFALLATWRRRQLPWVIAIAWAVYTIYELAMRYRILCSGECNIRIDLLLIHPALVVLSIAALISALRPPGR